MINSSVFMQWNTFNLHIYASFKCIWPAFVVVINCGFYWKHNKPNWIYHINGKVAWMEIIYYIIVAYETIWDIIVKMLLNSGHNKCFNLTNWHIFFMSKSKNWFLSLQIGNYVFQPIYFKWFVSTKHSKTAKYTAVY